MGTLLNQGMRRPGLGNLRHQENNAARANAGYSAPAGRGLPSAVDFDPLLDPAWPPSPYSPSTLWGPCHGTSWMLLTTAPSTSTTPTVRRCSGTLGTTSPPTCSPCTLQAALRSPSAVRGACHAQPPPRSQQLSKASGVLVEGLLGMHYTGGLPDK